MEADRHARDLAARQGGVILRSQATALGLNAHQIRYRRQSGDWASAGRGAYRLIDMPGHLDLVRSAIATLPNAVASHETAAELHAIRGVRRGLAVVTVHSRTTHYFPGVAVHRAHDLRSAHVTSIAGIDVTTVPRTVVDLAAHLTLEHLVDIVEDLMAADRLVGSAFAEVVGDVARRGRPGSRKLRTVLDEYVAGAAIRASVMERRSRRLLARAGLPTPFTEYPVPWSRSRRFDDAYPEKKVAIEWDGRRWHMRRDAFDADRHRDNEAHRHGWHVYRFTWRDITIRPHYVIETISTALQQRLG